MADAVLVVEDDADIGAMLESRARARPAFRSNGSIRPTARSRPHGRHHAPSADPARRHVARRHRWRSLPLACASSGFAGPILFLSAKDEISDRADGLAAGGDDYIVKPFVLRRARRPVAAPSCSAATASCDRRPLVGGRRPDASTTTRAMSASAMLVGEASPSARLNCSALFMEAPNKPIARGDIFDRLWNGTGQRLAQRRRCLHRLSPHTSSARSTQQSAARRIATVRGVAASCWRRCVDRRAKRSFRRFNIERSGMKRFLGKKASEIRDDDLLAKTSRFVGI